MLRVGSVPYLVGRPLDLGLEDTPGIDVRRDVPARLVEDLRAGALDVALVSSIELFRRPGYRFLEGVAVAGRGFVGSVQVFLRRPLDEVRRVALDPASRTGAALSRTMLAERDGETPAFVEVPHGVDPRTVDADGWLRIGDAALRETVEGGVPAWNPSLAFTEATGLPFVFASWIVREGVEISPFLDAFRAARRRGAAATRALADEAAGTWGLAVEACRDYLEGECLYEPGADQRAALRAFRDRAARLDLCDAGLDPTPIPLAE